MPPSQGTYILPHDLHTALSIERISVSPTHEPEGQGADFYAFAFDNPQDQQVNAFGATPVEAVGKVLKQLGKAFHVADDYPLTCDAAVAAIQFALKDSDGIQFLRCWNEGNFDALRTEWDEVPEEVFIGADSLHKATQLCD